MNITRKKINLIAYVKSQYLEYRDCGRHIMIPCPFHAEKTASCAIYEDGYHCFGAGCGAHGGYLDFFENLGINIDDVGSEYESSQYKKSNKQKSTLKYKLPPGISLKKYASRLSKDEEKLSYLYSRHFDYESVVKAQIGHSGNSAPPWFKNYQSPRYSIPVFDINKKNIISARYRIDPSCKNSDEPKYLMHPKAEMFLYNSHIIERNKNLVLVGSDLDAAFLYYRYNIAAISLPGEGIFKKEWGHMFVGKNVLVWLDYDWAGIVGAINAYNIIKPYGNPQIYEWDGSYSMKDDVCDFVTKNSIKEFVEELKRYGVKAKDKLGN